MLQPQSVLVTGASGFVGTWLRRRLPAALAAGSTIVGVDRRANGSSNADVTLDITDLTAVDDLVREVRPNAVVHLAAISTVDGSRLSARGAWNVNFYATMNLAEAVLRHAPEARFIFASSSEIYAGSTPAGAATLVDESTLLKPQNIYAATKAAADLMLGQMAEDGLRSVRFRPFNHTGPGQSTDFVVPAFAAQIAAIEHGERPPVLKAGNLDAWRDFLDVRDVVEAYVLAIRHPSLPKDVIFNLASGRPRRIGDILDALLSMSRAEIQVEQAPTLMRQSETRIMAGDARLAADALGWRPAVPWEATLSEVLASHRLSRARPV